MAPPKNTMQIEMVNIGDVSPAAQNSRVHTEDQIDQIAVSLEEFGWTLPVLVDEDGVLIAGHARIRAAQKLGMTTVPVVRAVGWSDNRKEAYLIADNKLAENSSWDTDILNAQIKRLASVDFNLAALGFDMADLDLGEAFNPNLTPKSGAGSVTGSEVATAKEKLDGAFAAGQTKPGDTYGIVCPHCGKDFEVQL